AHSSLRFTLGRFTTEEEIDYVLSQVRSQVDRLRDLSPLWDMFKEGIDLKSVKWAAH
ncbi:MAG: IscS subfamily cysteine desulfurase, partial [Gammaproteobacteria bacterium]|nr:IscS subfamily cysteine desulfurase [Gammaproteobacteria bacterium]